MTYDEATFPVAFKVEVNGSDEKFCYKCFHEVFHGKKIRFCPFSRAAQNLSTLKTCFHCKKEIDTRS